MVGVYAGSTKSSFWQTTWKRALARTCRTMEGIIQHNPELQSETEFQSKSIYLNNGTEISAISSDYAGVTHRK